jgi:hypothetical protein
MNALITLEQPCLPVAFEAELELAADFAKASKAKATIEAYESDFRIFEAWCRARGLNALPATPSTVCAFLAAQAGLGKRASTLGRRLAAIRYFHKLANETNPIGDETIKAVLSGIRRTIAFQLRQSRSRVISTVYHAECHHTPAAGDPQPAHTRSGSKGAPF